MAFTAAAEATTESIIIAWPIIEYFLASWDEMLPVERYMHIVIFLVLVMELYWDISPVHFVCGH